MRRIAQIGLWGLIGIQGFVAGTLANPAAGQHRSLCATSGMAAVGAFGGTIQTFTLSEDHAYVSEGMSFVVFDMANPSNPVETGRCLLPDMAWQIQIVGDHAYVAAWSKGLQVLDISDPSAPEVVGSWVPDTSGRWAYAVAVNNDYAYLGGSDDLMVLDVSDPTAPAFLKDIGGTFAAREMVMAGGYLYLAGNSAGMVIYSLDDPSTPSYVTDFNPAGYGYTQGLALSGNLAFVTDGKYGLRIVDITNPAAPIQVGKYPEAYQHSGYFKKVALAGNFAYLTDEQGLWTVDVSTPAAPAYHSYVAVSNGLGPVSCASGHVIAAQQQLKVFTAASGDTAPQQVAEYASLYDVNVLVASDDMLLAGARVGPVLYRLAITNPVRPQTTARYPSFGGCDAMRIRDDTAYVCGGSGENLRIFDLSSADEIRYQGSLATPGWASRLDLSGNLIFVGDGSSGVLTVDAATPATPRQLDAYAMNLANDITYGEGYLYVADGLGTILVLDVSDPSAITLAGEYALDTNIVRIWKRYLVARGSVPSTFVILDVTDPAALELKTMRYLAINNIVDITVADGLAYILGSLSGGNLGARSTLLVYDLSNPTYPVQIAQFDMPAGAERVTVAGKYTYIGLGFRGLLIGHLLLPRIADVQPALAPAGWATPFSIRGEGFEDGATVTIGETVADIADVIDDTRIESLIPAALPAGVYDVRVTNPGGASHTRTNLLTVLNATMEGVFAQDSDLFTTPAPPRATETTALALHVQRLGDAAALTNYPVTFYKGDPNRNGTVIGTGTVASLPSEGIGTTTPVNWTPEYAQATHIYAVLGDSDISVHREIRVFPSSSDAVAPVVNQLLINGTAGSKDTADRNVTLQINATDTGGTLKSMWIAEYHWSPGLGRWQIVNESGWLAYESPTSWTLSRVPGSRFIGVWVADNAGNISAEAGSAHINLSHPNMMISQGETQIFNYDLTAGQAVSIRVTPSSGDPDIYVGTYASGILFYSNLSGTLADSVTFNVPTTDWYSFMVYGYTPATYSIVTSGASTLSTRPVTFAKETPIFGFPRTGPPVKAGLPAAPVDGSAGEPFFLFIRGIQSYQAEILLPVLSETGTMLRLERTLSLTAPLWQAVGDAVPGTGEMVWLSDTNPLLPTAFYRVERIAP